MAKTGDDLLSAVQLTITMPNNQVLLTDERVLHFANDEMYSSVQEGILSLRQEYFVYLDESDQTVVDQANYDIPYRAIGRTLRDLKVKDSNSTNVFNCTQIALEDAHIFQNSSNMFGYYFQGDQIHMVPAPNSTAFYLMKYYLLRPNRIVQTTDAGQVQGIAGNVITLDAVPSTFTANTSVDFIQGKQGNRTLAMDQTITNVSGLQVTISTPPSSLVVGDYVSLAEETPVIQLPDEAFTYLVMLTAKRCLYAIGDYEGMKAVDEQIPEKRSLLEKALAPRNEGATTKIVGRSGLLRGRRNSYWRGVFR